MTSTPLVAALLLLGAGIQIVVSAQPLLKAPSCNEGHFEQELDHFHWRGIRGGDGAQPTFKQRYYTNDDFWSTNADGTRGPIFFYAGNEGPVTTYLEHTGLIWENAQEFGALVLFVEHRYYGKTQPFGPHSWKIDPSYLTKEQALADYATLLWSLTRQWGAEDSPVIAFGGSYGGMLAAYMRLKYPHLVDGAIAASAPMGMFPGVPGWNPSAFWEVVTRDATAEHGAAAECSGNVRQAYRHLFALGATAGGRAQLQSWLKLCGEIQSIQDVAYWILGAFDAYAMGNYPYPSNYMIGGKGELPAWPMRAACEHMRGEGLGAESLLSQLANAVGLMYNNTGDKECYSLEGAGPAAANTGSWDYQVCTELEGQEVPYYPTTGVKDMFWDDGPFNLTAIHQHCLESWGVAPRDFWSATEFGGLAVWSATTNIVFSNGDLDPWSSFGVLEDVSDTVVALLVKDGAHHLDLMFSHPDDPDTVTQARKVEVQHMRRWAEEGRARRIGQYAAAHTKDGTAQLRLHRGRPQSQPGQRFIKGVSSIVS